MSACMASTRKRPALHLPGVLLAALLTCAPVQAATGAAVSVPRHLIDPGVPKIDDPDTLVQQYLDAVDHGELTVFGTRLERTMLVPVRVEYVYDLASRTMLIKVHAHLKTPLPVPGRSDCRILSVSATLEDGSIAEIESHVWIRE